MLIYGLKENKIHFAAESNFHANQRLSIESFSSNNTHDKHKVENSDFVLIMKVLSASPYTYKNSMSGKGRVASKVIVGII